eukprot:TRINITY_DN39260_c0_g1_i3.p1 TRINITY_DN39260_c0_g1~~TRINITY_DN39260_c0_g1_i3.p1  ORF type:complete len:447 (-),score=47.77 TRINITY_DN39260_c0_g1_i3:652-1992(-)
MDPAKLRDDAVMLHSMFPCYTLVRLAELLRQHRGHAKRVIRAVRSELKRETRAKLSVAIIGGGIGGLALALALQHRGVSCRVFERDAHFDERRQGYGLTMQQGTSALKALGFNVDVGDSLGVHSTRHVVLTSDGKQVGEWGQRKWGRDVAKRKASRNNFHIPRQCLRKLLFDALRAGTVIWDHRFVGFSEAEVGLPMQRAATLSPNIKLSSGAKSGYGAEPAEPMVLPPTHESDEQALPCVRGRSVRAMSAGEDMTPSASNINQYNVQFVRADGSTAEYKSHVIVGCDGINGSVRKKLGDSDGTLFPLQYLGVLVVLGIVDNLPDGSPGADVADGKSAFQMSDTDTRLFGMPFNKTQTMWQLSWPMDQDAAIALASEGAASLKAMALALCGDWAPPVPQLLGATKVELISGWPVSDRQQVTSECFEGSLGFVRSAPVTLLGQGFPD